MQGQSNSNFILVSPYVAAKASFLLKYQWDMSIRVSALRVKKCYQSKELANRSDVKVVMDSVEQFKKSYPAIVSHSQLSLHF